MYNSRIAAPEALAPAAAAAHTALQQLVCLLQHGITTASLPPQRIRTCTPLGP